MILSTDINDQRILQSDWARGTTGRTQPKVVVSGATFTSWLSLCKKSKISSDSFLRYWWRKNPAIGLVKKNNWPHPTKRYSQMLPLLDDYLHAKCLWECWISSRYIDDQRILQSDWTRGTTGCSTQLKEVVSDATSLWCLSPFKKPKRSIDSFHRYWWSMNNNAISLAESILGHNWRNRFFPDIGFLNGHKEHCYGPFSG